MRFLWLTWGSKLFRRLLRRKDPEPQTSQEKKRGKYRIIILNLEDSGRHTKLILVYDATTEHIKPIGHFDMKDSSPIPIPPIPRVVEALDLYKWSKKQVETPLDSI